MRLIVTRPEPDATRTARALIRLGHEAILSPALEIVHRPDAAIPERDYQAILATSSNGVRALSAVKSAAFLSKATPLLAVGDQTALEAKRGGFVAARSAGGALDDLAALAEAELKPRAGALLYVAGEEQSGDLAARLAASGFDVETAILYRAEPVARLANVAVEALRERSVDGILFYSARSAAAFALALRSADLAPLDAGIACFCLSASVSETLSKVAAGARLVAERPDQLALFALIEAEAARRASASG